MKTSSVSSCLQGMCWGQELCVGAVSLVQTQEGPVIHLQIHTGPSGGSLAHTGWDTWQTELTLVSIWARGQREAGETLRMALNVDKFWNRDSGQCHLGVKGQHDTSWCRLQMSEKYYNWHVCEQGWLTTHF